MTDLTDTLEKIIQQAALDGAMTEDAVAQFHTLVVERNALKDANVEWEENDKKLKKELETLAVDLDIAKGLNKVAAEAEMAMIEREQNITTLELTAKHQAERVEDHKDMVKLIFRNTVLKKGVMTPAGSHTDVNGASSSTYSDRNEVEEEEK